MNITLEEHTAVIADGILPASTMPLPRAEGPGAVQDERKSSPADRSTEPTDERLVRPHGTYGKYKTERCHCPDCRRANRDINRRWSRTKAMVAHGMAEPPWLEAEPVRQHIRDLTAAGISVLSIQRISGVSKAVLDRLIYGCPHRGEAPSRKIRPANAAPLMAIPVPPPTDDAVVDATGTRRRLQALVAVGWSGAELMRRIGIVGTDFPKILGREQILARTERKIRALYDQVWDVPPPASTRWERATLTRALAFAANRGWAPPMAWDDDTIDDPATQPAGVLRDAAAPPATADLTHQSRTAVPAPAGCRSKRRTS
jgi:hypothetical protein